MKALEAQYTEQMQTLRVLWNEFDPIGVYEDNSDCPLDEYESYCTPCLKLLKANAPPSELISYIETALNRMGIEGYIQNKEIKNFALKMQEWFESYGFHLSA